MTTAEEGAPGARLEPLPSLPVFFKLTGRRALVAGGDQPAVWKTELLLATGAAVDVVTTQPCPDLEALVGSSGGSPVRLIVRDWSDGDLAGAAIAIGSMPTDAEAERFRQAANRFGVPVNVIDRPAFCDFQFGTIVSRSPLVLAITTDGAAPVLGQALRTRLESLLPQGLRSWAGAAKSWRPRIDSRDWDFRRRRRFWEVFAQEALRPDAPEPDEMVFQSCLKAAERESAERPARLTLIGCGSGRPDDLTLSAARALQDADVIYFDPDVGRETVALARREARKIGIGEAGAIPTTDLSAGGGRNIAWLGTGDPARCQHWAERRRLLEAVTTEIDVERGLQTCPRCRGHCVAASG